MSPDAIAGAAIAAVGLGALALGPGGGLARLTSGPKAQGQIAALARKWGTAFGVPWDWIMGIAKVESGYRPGARSSAASDATRGGSWGAMQVSLKTAQGIAADLAKSDSPSVRATLGRWHGLGSDLLDADVGVMFGSYYLRKLRSSGLGDFAQVAAAYNQGAGRVQKLLAAGQFPGGLTPHGKDYVAKTEAGRREAIA